MRCACRCSRATSADETFLSLQLSETLALIYASGLAYKRGKHGADRAQIRENMGEQAYNEMRAEEVSLLTSTARVLVPAHSLHVDSEGQGVHASAHREEEAAARRLEEVDSARGGDRRRGACFLLPQSDVALTRLITGRCSSRLPSTSRPPSSTRSASDGAAGTTASRSRRSPS